MSPEANHPSTQAGSDHFVEGYHPTDGVRPFKKGELADVGDSLISETPEDLSNLDPHTLGLREVNKVPLEPEKNEKNKRRFTIAMGGGVLAVVTAAGAMLGLSGNGNEAPERPATSSSATPNPGEKSATPPEAPVENKAGEALLADIDGVPSKEASEYAASHPILVEGDQPNAASAKKAAELMGQYMNVYTNGGEMNGLDMTLWSNETGDKILDNVYGPVEVRNPNSNVDLQQLKNERDSVAASFLTYPDLKSSMRFEVQGEPQLLNNGSNELWQVQVKEIHSGNWDTLTDIPERNKDYDATIYLATYMSPEGLVWYHFDGSSTEIPTDLK